MHAQAHGLFLSPPPLLPARPTRDVGPVCTRRGAPLPATKLYYYQQNSPCWCTTPVEGIMGTKAETQVAPARARTASRRTILSSLFVLVWGGAVWVSWWVSGGVLGIGMQRRDRSMAPLHKRAQGGGERPLPHGRVGPHRAIHATACSGVRGGGVSGPRVPVRCLGQVSTRAGILCLGWGGEKEGNSSHPISPRGCLVQSMPTTNHSRVPRWTAKRGRERQSQSPWPCGQQGKRPRPPRELQ